MLDEVAAFIAKEKGSGNSRPRPRSILGPLYDAAKHLKNRARAICGFAEPVGSGPVIGFRDALSGPPKGRALVSYITGPFHRRDASSWGRHQNRWEAVEIARILNKLGVVVDVVDYFDVEFEPSAAYTLLFGQNDVFDRFVEVLGEDTVKIYYATGAHWSFETQAEQGRLDRLEQRRGVKLRPRGPVQPHRSAELADAVICKGNEFTRSTYRPYNADTLPIDPSSFDFLEWPEGQQFASARRRFLWFGGRGMVRKGLDLVLEVFKDLPDCELIVGGPVQKEPDFVEAYQEELFRTPNINLLGWMDIQSKLFKRVTQRCGYVILPSCSEGCAGSVVACMHRGLVPIVTRETGVDTADFGVTLKDSMIETLRSAVVEASRQPGTHLEECSRGAYEEAKRRYTRAAFSRKFEEVMCGLLEKHY